MTDLPDSTDLVRRSIGARRNPASHEAILDAAQAILQEEGPGGFSIEAVARRARAGKPTIYRWWPNRTALMLDVYQRFKASRPFPDTGTLRGDLVALLRDHLLEFWLGSVCGTVYRAVIAEAQADPAAAQALEAYQQERKKATLVIVDRAKARGEMDAGVDGALLIELVVSYAWHQLLLGRLEAALQQVEPVIDILLRGFGNDRTRP